MESCGPGSTPLAVVSSERRIGRKMTMSEIGLSAVAVAHVFSSPRSRQTSIARRWSA